MQLDDMVIGHHLFVFALEKNTQLHCSLLGLSKGRLPTGMGIFGRILIKVFIILVRNNSLIFWELNFKAKNGPKLL